MTLITVVCYDFVVFNHLKSHTFEKSTLSPVRLFYGNSGSKKNCLYFLFRPFYVRLKTPRRKNNLFDFCRNKRSFVGKNPTAAYFDGNLINRSICKIFALSCVVYTGFQAPFYG